MERIKNEIEFLIAIKSRAQLIDMAKLRWRLNPHHPEVDKRYEELSVDIETLDYDREIYTYLCLNRPAMLVSPDPEVRQAIKGIEDIYPGYFRKEHLGILLDHVNSEQRKAIEEREGLRRKECCGEELGLKWKHCPICGEEV